ncbi:intraflagellar transport protein 88 homolog [Macrosteles quadrilineatus]|uniref:intraflagellar transport protein 88 homolog n=1 Tax=Macrosteles quadrilineatus TaxID=74068 RepID=UPI0023E0D1E4|nr:intraflagellar transport protein 88 homolog [Macrosteles quadrilineatus]
METIRFVPDDEEEDLYSGFNDFPSPLFNTKDLDQDEYVQIALRSSYSKRPGLLTSKPGTAMRFGTSSGYREGSVRVMTGQDPVTRPMTAVRGAGYTSAGRAGSVFDPLNQASAPPLVHAKAEEKPEDKIKKLERRITELIDESCLAASKQQLRQALDKAKEASTKERNLIRLQEQAGLSDTHNLDLTFSVLFNLASQYAANEMYSEAINTYLVITKNRMFHNSNKLKVNIGNIYVKLGQYPKAIKMYRMALDQVPNTHKDLRIKIMHNIGILFVKMGQFSDACTSFEYIMQEKPDFKAGLHAIVCYYALDDKDRMKQGFQMLLEVVLDIDDDEKYIPTSDDPASNLVLEAIRTDSLHALEKQMKREAERSILTAAKLIAPVIEDNFTAGYNWCVEAINSSIYAPLAGDLEINKAVMFLKQKDIAQAMDTLKTFQRKESKVASTAASNMAFVHFLQGDLEQAEKCGEMAKEVDGYNAAAYVNLGNCSLAKGDQQKAKQLYTLALDNDTSCTEALYNLGLVNKQMGLFEDSLDCFLKLHAIVNHHPQVLYQLAHLHELVGDVDQSVEWFLQLLGIIPTDAGVLHKLGEIFDGENDKQQAYHYHFESFRYFPSNFAVLDWLGAYFVSMQVAEKAVAYYEKAALMQPNEPKWRLLIGSCHRRSGNYQLALRTYKDILQEFPENIECLKFLVRMCSDMGLPEAATYAMQLKKAEKAKELRERIGSSQSGTGSRRSSGRSSQGVASPLSDSTPPTRGSLTSASRQAKLSVLESGAEPSFGRSQFQNIDASYSDPLGPQERPRTAARSRSQVDDEFGDEDLAEFLLPE